MTLKEWRRKNRVSQHAFGVLIGRTRVTIARYETGISLPSRSAMKRIAEVTQNEVLPNDWHSVPLLSDQVRAA